MFHRADLQKEGQVIAVYGKSFGLSGGEMERPKEPPPVQGPRAPDANLEAIRAYHDKNYQRAFELLSTDKNATTLTADTCWEHFTSTVGECEPITAQALRWYEDAAQVYEYHARPALARFIGMANLECNPTTRVHKVTSTGPFKMGII